MAGINTPVSEFQSLFSWMFRSKPRKTSVSAWGISRFNPCSRGCFARSQYQKVDEMIRQGFQSLFSWMFRSKMRSCQSFRSSGRFQSLFSWMFRSKYGRDYQTMVALIRFQSLFSWMFRSKDSTSISWWIQLSVSILVLVDVSLEVAACY